MAGTTYIFARPTLMPVGDINLYELAADWTVRTPYGDFTVPAGFTYDGASIPRFFWRVTGGPFQSPRCIAALLHDYLYATHKVDRATADKIYRDMQIALAAFTVAYCNKQFALGISKFKARIAKFKARIEYRVLRIFGGFAWRNAARVAMLAVCLMAAGCASKMRMVDGRGMYANTNTGVVGIGQLEVVAVPEGVESFVANYSEDVAWLSPGVKTHAVKIAMTGTNCTSHVESVVKSICEAFGEVHTNNVGGVVNGGSHEPAE